MFNTCTKENTNCRYCSEDYSPDTGILYLCMIGDNKCPEEISETGMKKVECPDNFNAENYEHLATVKAERSGGYAEGDLYYSIDRNKYNLKDVPLETGYYTKDEYLYRVVNNSYNDFTIIETKKIK